MLLCKVAKGNVLQTRENMDKLTGSAPAGYHSVHGIAMADGPLNYDELVVFDQDAVLPYAVVTYEFVKKTLDDSTSSQTEELQQDTAALPESPGTASEPDPKVRQLMDMGFKQAACEGALRREGSVEAAAAMLVDSSVARAAASTLSDQPGSPRSSRTTTSEQRIAARKAKEERQQRARRRAQGRPEEEPAPAPAAKEPRNAKQARIVAQQTAEEAADALAADAQNSELMAPKKRLEQVGATGGGGGGADVDEAARIRVVVVAATDSEPEAEPERQPISAEPLSLRTVKKGMGVQLIADSSMRGKVRLIAGKASKVNFSESGISEEQWIPHSDLQLVGATIAASEPETAQPIVADMYEDIDSDDSAEPGPEPEADPAIEQLRDQVAAQQQTVDFLRREGVPVHAIEADLQARQAQLDALTTVPSAATRSGGGGPCLAAHEAEPEPEPEHVVSEGSVVVEGAGTEYFNGIYEPNGKLRGKTKYRRCRGSGETLEWEKGTWVLKLHVPYYSSPPGVTSVQDQPPSQGWKVKGTAAKRPSPTVRVLSVSDLAVQPKPPPPAGTAAAALVGAGGGRGGVAAASGGAAADGRCDGGVKMAKIRKAEAPRHAAEAEAAEAHGWTDRQKADAKSEDAAAATDKVLKVIVLGDSG
jgi:hypothetical protein